MTEQNGMSYQSNMENIHKVSFFIGSLLSTPFFISFVIYGVGYIHMDPKKSALSFYYCCAGYGVCK